MAEDPRPPRDDRGEPGPVVVGVYRRRWVARCIRGWWCMPMGGSWPAWRWAAGVVRALRMARSDAAGEAGWRDLTGKLVFPGPVVLWRFGVPQAGSGGLPATTVGVPAPIPLLRGVEPELEALPEAVFGHGCAAFAVDDRIRAEPGWDGDLVRVTGHCGATLVVLSDDARVMKRSAAGRMPPLGRAAGSAPTPVREPL